MMDYYGSIVKGEYEIDSELIQRFRDRCHESLIKKLIRDLRKEQVLLKEYSVSGWMVFHGKTIYGIISIELDSALKKAEQRIKLLYCYNQLFNEHEIEICRMICDKI
jgi:hypothetical protein